MSEIPRRNRHDLHTAAEKAITAAMEAVEEAGCDQLLTEAVCLLADARNKVADWVERDRFTEVALNAIGGGLAAYVKILAYAERPPLVTWGSRFFMDTECDDADGRPIFAETIFAVALDKAIVGVEWMPTKNKATTVVELRNERNREHGCANPLIQCTSSGMGDRTVLQCICGNSSSTSKKEEAALRR